MTSVLTRQRSPLCQSVPEEIASSISHGIGVLLSVGALVWMVLESVHHGSSWHVVSTSIFGGSLALLYLMSCLYHALDGPRVKRVFQVLDHAAIFVLIAGTYTPFLLVNLRGPWGWSLFGVVWGLALAGIIAKAILLPRYEKRTSLVYLVMGWLVVLALKPLLASLSTAGFSWLVAGGVSYSVGVVFFVLERVRFAHLIWHLFVLAGSGCHVMAVLHGVIPHEGP